MRERAETAGRADTCDVTLQHVTVRDLRVAADIGVHSHEIGRRQMLVLTVTLGVRLVSDDRLAETIDYNVIVSAALALAEERVALIETFADRLAQACLRDPAVIEADVVVEKPSALTNGVASSRVVRRRRG